MKAEKRLVVIVTSLIAVQKLVPHVLDEIGSGQRFRRLVDIGSPHSARRPDGTREGFMISVDDRDHGSLSVVYPKRVISGAQSESIKCNSRSGN